MKTKLITALTVAAVALATAAVAWPHSSAPRLTGTVGPGFTITLKQAGKKVTSLKAGKYTFVVTDKASIHNFEIEGPGVDKAITTVPFMGTKTVTLTLKRGTYKYYCKPHESGMFGKFKVT